VLRHNLSRAVRSPSSCGSHTCLTALALRFELRARAKKPLTAQSVDPSLHADRAASHGKAHARPAGHVPATTERQRRRTREKQTSARTKNNPARGRKNPARWTRQSSHGTLTEGFPPVRGNVSWCQNRWKSEIYFPT